MREFDNMREKSIQARFEAFHEANPHVYEVLVTLARQAKVAGKEKIGIGMLWEVMRWNQFISTDSKKEGYKLSNDFRSRYARMIMEQEEDLVGIFNVRELTAM